MAETNVVPAAVLTPVKPESETKKRQLVAFTFFKVMPEWRRLPLAERVAHKRAFAEVIQKWNKPGQLLTLTYSTVGLRPDCDMVLWRICYTMEDLNQMTADLIATPLGGYLETTHSFIAMTKRSQYLIGQGPEGVAESRATIRIEADQGRRRVAHLLRHVNARRYRVR